MSGRIAHRGLRQRVVSASEAAAQILPGNNDGRLDRRGLVAVRSRRP
jgi:hypothetical protein